MSEETNSCPAKISSQVPSVCWSIHDVSVNVFINQVLEYASLCKNASSYVQQFLRISFSYSSQTRLDNVFDTLLMTR